MPARTRRLALAEGVTAGLLFGSAAIFTRYLPDLDPFIIVLGRLAVACAVLSLAAIVLRKSLSFSLNRKNLKYLALLGLLLAIHFVLFTSAVKDTTILNATILVNTTPIFSLAISTLVMGLSPRRFAVLGLVFSIIGIGIIAYAESMKMSTDVSSAMITPSLKGDFEAVMAAFVLSIYLNLGERIRRQATVIPSMIPIYAIAGAVAGILSLSVTRVNQPVMNSPSNFVALVGLGLFPTAMAHTLFFSSLSNLRSFETATLALIEPVGATVLGVALFQEVPSPLFVLGAALIFVGILSIVAEKD